MKYPEDFKQRVKETYPSNPFGIFEMMDKGNVFVGRILDDSSCGTIRNQDILDADTPEKVQALKDKAADYKQRRQLYSDWCKLYQAACLR